MTLAAGARLGPYEIAALIGSGGMGEVYRARDTRLGRDVAIKILPAEFSVDSERLRRFEQEARAAASLNHSGILALYDIGTDHGAPYIVAELLEGDTLRDRLRRVSTTGGSVDGGGLTLRKAIDYAIQVARGLSAAHDKGIVHRDLKPENLFVTADGRMKILDFGLAKLTESSVALAGAASLATAPVGTEAGVLLGSMGYMAPEQVRGQSADHRADIFAFGAILYEMLTGQRAFAGATSADTISAILDKDPPDAPLNLRQVPPALQRVIDRCLEKSPAARFQSTHDLAFALEGLSAQSESGATIAAVATHGRSSASRRERIAWAIAALLALALGVAVVQYLKAPAAEQRAIRFTIPSPAGASLVAGAPGTVALSPDGRRIVFAANAPNGGAQMLWVQPLDSLDARVLPGTEHGGPSGAFWSPDSRFIAFFAGGKLKKIDIGGGSPQVLCDVEGQQLGGTWGRRDVIVFATVSAGLKRVAASGGQAVAATTLDPSGETSHRRPSFLPDGTRFTYIVQPGNVVRVGSLDSGTATTLFNADSMAVYSAGHLLFVRQGTLFSHPFDPTSLKLSGDAVPVAEQIGSNVATAGAGFTASENGVVAYVRGVATGGAISSQLTWIDRNGKPLGSVGAVADYRGLELSASERRLAEHPHEGGPGGDVWLRDLSRETMARLTFAGHNTSPIWSPDETRVAFGSNRPAAGQAPADQYGGRFDIFEKRADGTGEMTVLVDSAAAKLPPGWKQPTSWSPDGQLIVFEALDPKTSWDLWALPLNGDRKPRPLLQSEFQELEGQISPDGRWLMYTSNENRRLEVFVRPLSNVAGKWQISTGGGSYPRWRRDGKELFYLSRDRKIMAVAVNSSGSAIEAGVPHALFDVRVATVFFTGDGFTANANAPYPYVVSNDGQRFLVAVDVSQASTAETPITLLYNWPATLRK